ncbi:hypothetical protein ABBQ38_011371 [Trebouxia sp. C0009 RCD-2024]
MHSNSFQCLNIASCLEQSHHPPLQLLLLHQHQLLPIPVSSSPIATRAVDPVSSPPTLSPFSYSPAVPQASPPSPTVTATPSPSFPAPSFPPPPVVSPPPPTPTPSPTLAPTLTPAPTSTPTSTPGAAPVIPAATPVAPAPGPSVLDSCQVVTAEVAVCGVSAEGIGAFSFASCVGALLGLPLGAAPQVVLSNTSDRGSLQQPWGHSSCCCDIVALVQLTVDTNCQAAGAAKFRTQRDLDWQRPILPLGGFVSILQQQSGEWRLISPLQVCIHAPDCGLRMGGKPPRAEIGQSGSFVFSTWLLQLLDKWCQLLAAPLSSTDSFPCFCVWCAGRPLLLSVPAAGVMLVVVQAD